VAPIQACDMFECIARFIRNCGDDKLNVTDFSRICIFNGNTEEERRICSS